MKHANAALLLDENLDSSFIEEISQLCQRIHNLLQDPISEKTLNELYRIVHTIKGVSASVDDKVLTQFLHKVETFIFHVKNHAQFKHPVIHPLLLDIHQYLISSVDLLRNKQTIKIIPSEILNRMFNAEADKIIHLSAAEVKNIVKNELNNKSQTLIVSKLHSIDLLNPYAQKMVKDLSLKLNKKCQIQFSKDTNMEVDSQIIELLKVTFTHLLRNALDHGIESAEERLRLGKHETGLLEIHFEKLDYKSLKIEIKDNGRGIVLEKLKKVLREKKFMTQEQINSLSDQQLNQMIFSDGLSTKEVVTDISGRGIGLNAVKEDIEKIAGNILVESKVGVGTKYVITLPLSHKKLL